LDAYAQDGLAKAVGQPAVAGLPAADVKPEPLRCLADSAI